MQVFLSYWLWASARNFWLAVLQVVHSELVIFNNITASAYKRNTSEFKINKLFLDHTSLLLTLRLIWSILFLTSGQFSVLIRKQQATDTFKNVNPQPVSYLLNALHDMHM
jgi:hypothetical protein